MPFMISSGVKLSKGKSLLINVVSAIFSISLFPIMGFTALSVL